MCEPRVGIVDLPFELLRAIVALALPPRPVGGDQAAELERQDVRLYVLARVSRAFAAAACDIDATRLMCAGPRDALAVAAYARCGWLRLDVVTSLTVLAASPVRSIQSLLSLRWLSRFDSRARPPGPPTCTY